MALPQLFAELADVPWLLTALDLVGVFFFAVSGALLAARKDFDLVGSVALALLAGLGGGITRDIVLDRGLPASLQDPIYLAPPVLVSLLVYVKAIHPNRLNLTITLFDAAGLALFTVSGVMIAHAMGVHPVSVVVVATVGALGGGVLRDIVANEVPSIFDPRGVYVMPAVVGAAVAELVAQRGALNAFTGFLIALLIFTVRMLAYRYQWRLPGADVSQDRDQLDRLRRAGATARGAGARAGRPTRGPRAGAHAASGVRPRRGGRGPGARGGLRPGHTGHHGGGSGLPPVGPVPPGDGRHGRHGPAHRPHPLLRRPGDGLGGGHRLGR